MKDHLDLLVSPIGSCKHSPASECCEWFYHPMRNFRKPINFDVTSGVVRMSDMFNDVCILVIFMLPFCISSRK
jgi:hypothetical protein